MKKIVKTSLFLTALLSAGIMTANAKTMTASDIEALAAVEFGGKVSSENVYVFGKNVYVNTITSADIVEAADTLDDDFRNMFGNNKSILIYKDSKNNWTNAHSGESLTKSKISIEMTRLIGDVVSGHISEDNDLYDYEFVETETLADGRKSEVFVDEKAELNIVGIRPVTKYPTLNNKVNTDKNAYNAAAITTSLNKDKLTITENTPLLSYTYRSVASSKKWIPVLVKTNKIITKNDIANIIINVAGSNYTIKTEDVELASDYGAAKNEFVLWLNEDIYGVNKNITFKSKSAKTAQTIEVDYEKPIVSFEYEINAPSDGSNVEINITTDNVEVASAKIDNKIYNIFYSSNKNLEKVNFTENGNKKVAVKSEEGEWNVHSLIDVKDPLVGVKFGTTTDKDHDWNQDKTTVTIEKNPEKTNENKYDYLVTVTTGQALKEYSYNNSRAKWVSLILDFNMKLSDLTLSGISGIKTDATATNVEKNGGESSTAFVYFYDGVERLLTVTNTNYNSDKIVIKFVVKDETPELEFSAQKGLEKDIIANPASQAENDINFKYIENWKATEFETYTEKDEKTGERLAEVVRLQTVSALQTAYKYNTNVNVSKKFIGVILDLGVDPTKLTVTDSDSTAAALWNSGKILAADIARAKEHGATSDTAFFVWVYPEANPRTLTFTYSETNASLKVKIEVEEFKVYTDAAIKNTATDTYNVTIADEYIKDVKYLGEGQFRVNNDITKFVVTIENTHKNGSNTTNTVTEYTYNVSGNTIKKTQNPNLLGAYNLEAASGDEIKYNMESVDSVKVIDKHNIEIEFNKTPNTKAVTGLLLDLGFTSTSLSNITIKNNEDALTKEPGNHILNSNSKIPDTVKDHLSIISLNTEEVLSKDGQTVKLTATDANGTTVVYEIVIKGTVKPNNSDLKLTDIRKPNVTSDLEDEDWYKNTVNLKTEVVNGEIVITYDRQFKEYTNSSDNGGSRGNVGYFAVLVDLGIKPEYITATKGYKFESNETDSKNIEMLGGESDKEFIMWLDNKCFTKEIIDGVETGRMVYEATFQSSANPDNKYSTITVKFVLVDATEELEINNVSERDPYDEPSNVSDTSLYKLNQERYSSVYNSTTSNDETVRTLTISALDKNLLATSYKIDGGTATQWYGVMIDFDSTHKNGISLAPTDTTNANSKAKLEPIEGSANSYILWINVSSATSFKDKPIKFVDNYDDEASALELNIVIK